MLVDPAFHPRPRLPVVVGTESTSDHGKLRRGEVATVDVERLHVAHRIGWISSDSSFCAAYPAVNPERLRDFFLNLFLSCLSGSESAPVNLPGVSHRLAGRSVARAAPSPASGIGWFLLPASGGQRDRFFAALASRPQNAAEQLLWDMDRRTRVLVKE